MAITAYTGLPRSGKSYSVVEYVILPAAKSGRTLYTNIPIKWDVLKADYPDHDIRPLDLEQFVFERAGKQVPDNERTDMREFFDPGCVVCIDELWRLWPAGVKTNRVPEDHKEFLAMHGHRVGENGIATEVVLVTQDLSQISSFVRDLVAKTSITKKLDAVGASKFANVAMYSGKVTGQIGPKGRLIRTAKIRYKESVYKYYQSHSQSVTGEAGNEKETDSRGNIFKSGAFIGTVTFMLAAGAFSTWVFSGVIADPVSIVGLSSEELEKASKEKAEKRGEAKTPEEIKAIRDQLAGIPQAATKKAADVVLQEKVPEVKYSQQWRLGGVIKSPSDPVGMAMLIGANGSKMITAETCERQPANTWSCEFNGELIEFWTGGGNYTGGRVERAPRGNEQTIVAGTGEGKGA